MTVEERDAILNIKIDATITIRDALSTQIIGWALTKANNLNAFNPDVQEITNLAGTYLSRTMTDDMKIDIVQKLQRLGVM